MVPM